MVAITRARPPVPRRANQAGFTLIEAVISLFLLAVMSVMSYQAVEVILDSNERSRGDLADEAQLHRAWQIISRDMMHLRPRGFADGFGSAERAYLTDPSDFGVRLVAAVDPWCVPIRPVSGVSNTASMMTISSSGSHGRLPRRRGTKRAAE